MNHLNDEPRLLRRILLSGAAVFGTSAIFLLFSPELFVELLGLQDSADLGWSMRMIAVTLVALTGNMAVVAGWAETTGVTVAAVVMMVSAGALGVLTLLIPAEPTWFTIAYAMVGFGFSTAYTVGLFLQTKKPRYTASNG